MANLTVASPGVQLVWANATAGGDEYVNDERTVLLLNNTSGAARTYTLAAQRTSVTVAAFGTLAIANISVVLSGDGLAAIQGPPAAYNNDSTGRASITYSSNSGVAVVPVRLNNVS